MKRYESKDFDDRHIIKCKKCPNKTHRERGIRDGWIVKGDTIICPGCPEEE